MSKGEETKQKIFKYALTLFSRQGYEQTSLRDIALKVEIKAPSIYAYFSSKEELFESIANHVMNNYLDFIRLQTLHTMDLAIEEKLYTLMEQTIKYLFDNDVVYFIIRYSLDPPEQFKDAIYWKFNQVDEEITKIIHDIVKYESSNYIDVNTIITSFFCILDGMLLYIGNSSREEYEIRLRTTMEVFIRGILK